jgi:hypothetical protein
MNLQEAKKLIKQHPGQFYTYLLKRPDGRPFYVGKGNCKSYRIEDHGIEALSFETYNTYKCNIIRKIWENGGQIDYEIALFTDSEKLAFDKEIELISFYGRRDKGTGILANMTDGGEGFCGGNAWNKGKGWSEASKQKMSKAKKGKPAHNKGIPMSEEQRNKMGKALKGKSAWNKGIPMTEEMKKKMSDSLKGRKAWNKGLKGVQIPWNKGLKGVQIPWNKGIPMSGESKERISASLKKQYIFTDLRERMSESHKHYTDDIKKRMSVSHKGKKIPLQQKIKMSESQKLRWAKIKEAQLCHQQ